MKHQFALAAGLLTVLACISTFHLPDPLMNGKAFITQANLSPNPSSDYDTAFGDQWQSVRTFRLMQPLEKPLKVYIQTSTSHYKPAYKAYTLKSLQMWNQALEGRLSFVLTPNRKDADITVEWVSTFPEKYVAGMTTYRIGSANIEIKTVDVPEQDILGNIIHEMGHALGITGHSRNPEDIMVAMRRWHRDNSPYDPKLSPQDVQAIQHLYSRAWQKGEDLYTAQRQAPRPAAQSAQELATGQQTPVTRAVQGEEFSPGK